MPSPDKNTAHTGTTNVRDSIQLRGRTIPVKHLEIAQTSLRFYTENPRVHSVVRAEGASATQEQIQTTLCTTEHVKRLAKAIKRDGGLTDPVIVSGKNMEVLEGNCRLAAYRLLASTEPLKWSKIRCTVLPSDIGEDVIFALLGQYHINGKLPWQTFEQAGFLYRRFMVHKNDLETLAEEIGMSVKAVSHYISVYRFMITNDDDRAHWSYYDEFFKSREIRDARKRYPDLDDRFVATVRTENEVKAMDVRSKLAKICKQDRILKRYVSGAIGLLEAFEQFVDSGADAGAYQKFSRFRTWLASEESAKELMGYSGAERQKTLLEIKKLEVLVTRLRRNFSETSLAKKSSSKRR